MQMRRTVQTKSRVSHSDDSYAMLVQMMNQVKAEVGDKSYAQVTPEVEEKLDEMLTYVEQIMQAIRDAQETAQNELTALMVSLENAEALTISHHSTAVSDDEANIACRTAEKTALWDWEQCIIDLDSCYVRITEECDTYDETYEFQLPTTHLDENDLYWCDFEDMKASSVELPENVDEYGWLDNAYKCTTFNFVWEKLKGYKTAWEEGFAGYLIEKAECTEEVPQDCADHAHRCAELWRTYLDKHLVCTEDCSTAKSSMCSFGVKYTDHCDALDAFELKETEIRENSPYVEGEERTTLSEADRILEYAAVVKIRCLIEDYVEGGNWLGETETCEAGAVYETEIGPFDYLEERKSAALDPWNCNRDELETTVELITFSGSMFDIGRASSSYVENAYSSKANLQGDPVAVFSFCSDGVDDGTGVLTLPSPESMCVQHEECGQTDMTTALNNFSTPTFALLNGWTVEPMEGDLPSRQTECEEMFNYESLCLVPPTSGTVFVGRDLAGPGIFEIYWGNFREADGDNVVELTLTHSDKTETFTAGSFDRTVKTDFVCETDTGCHMELKAATGELILHTVAIQECNGEEVR